MYLSQATRLGPLAATAGFVFVFALSLVDFLPIPKLISHGLSWIWVVVAVPMVVLVLVNAMIGPNPATLARKGIAKRLRATAALLEGAPKAEAEAHALLAEDSNGIRRLAKIARLFSYHSSSDARRICGMSDRSQDLLALALASGHDPELAADLTVLAEAIATRHTDLPFRHMHAARQATRQLAQQGDFIAAIWIGRADHACPEPEKEGFFVADAFSNPVYWQFALKTVIAAFVTYAIYTAWSWFEIHTAMITCFYVALGSTGETLHKASLRIVGALIGGAMGIASIIFLMPHMTDIGQLMLLVGAGALLAAWVANGSTLIQYAGWQMALAFFLCVLPPVTTSFLPNGFGPVYDVNVATDRVLGILIGNVIVALVFLSLWPVSIGAEVTRALDKAARTLHRILAQQEARLADVWQTLAEARRLAGLSMFEVSRLRMRAPVMPHVPAILSALETAGAAMTRVALGRGKQHYLFGAPRSAKAALEAHENATSAFVDLAASAMVAPEPQARAMLIAALDKSARTLDHLRRLVARTPRRSRWYADLAEAATEYTRLQSDLENVVAGVR